ncbi:hypothetical protein ACJA27_01265 [Mycoplasmopsis lipophila]|uniref:hypothetical protein n=1 Tax=Mycoplasmopsis lipophila TaxID=2117 RepID=UPI0038738F01
MDNNNFNNGQNPMQPNFDPNAMMGQQPNPMQPNGQNPMQPNFDPNAMMGQQPNPMQPGVDPNMVMGQQNPMQPGMNPNANNSLALVQNQGMDPNSMFPTTMMPMPTNQFTYELMTVQPAFNPQYAMYDPNVAEKIKKQQKKKIIATSIGVSVGLVVLAGGITTASIFLKQKAAKDQKNSVLQEIKNQENSLSNLVNSLNEKPESEKSDYLAELGKQTKDEIRKMVDEVQKSNQIAVIKTTLSTIKNKVVGYKEEFEGYYRQKDLIKNIKDTEKFESRDKSLWDSIKERLNSVDNNGASGGSSFEKIRRYFKTRYELLCDELIKYLDLKDVQTTRKLLEAEVQKFRNSQNEYSLKLRTFLDEVSRLQDIHYAVNSDSSNLYPSDFNSSNIDQVFNLNAEDTNIHKKYYKSEVDGQPTCDLIPNDQTGQLKLNIKYYYPLDGTNEKVLVSDKRGKVVSGVKNSKSIQNTNDTPTLNATPILLSENQKPEWTEEAVNKLVQEFRKKNDEWISRLGVNNFESNENIFKNSELSKLFSMKIENRTKLNSNFKYEIKSIDLESEGRVSITYIIKHELIVGYDVETRKFIKKTDSTSELQTTVSVNSTIEATNNYHAKKLLLEKTNNEIFDENNNQSIMYFIKNTVNKNYDNETKEGHKEIFDSNFDNYIKTQKEFVQSFENNKIVEIDKKKWEDTFAKILADWKNRKKRYEDKKEVMNQLWDLLTNSNKEWKSQVYNPSNSDNYFNNNYLLVSGDYESNNSGARNNLQKEAQEIEKKYKDFLNSNNYDENTLRNKINEFQNQDLVNFKNKVDKHKNQSKILYERNKKVKAWLTSNQTKYNESGTSEESKRLYEQLKSESEKASETFSTQPDPDKIAIQVTSLMEIANKTSTQWGSVIFS